MEKQIIKIEQLMQMQFSENKWLVEHLVPYQAVTAISAHPGVGKTWMILQMALSIASGAPFAKQFETTKSGVLIVDEEMGLRNIKERIELLSDHNILDIYFLSESNFKLTNNSVEKLILFAQEHDVQCIMFDSLVRVHIAKNENDSVEMAKVFGLIQELKKAGLSVVFTHHHRKGSRFDNGQQDMRGSSDISAAVDAHISLKKIDTNYIEATISKMRHAKSISPFRLKIEETDSRIAIQLIGQIEVNVSKREKIKEAILEALKRREMNQQEIVRYLKKRGLLNSAETLRPILAELSGKIDIKRGYRNSKIYSISKRPK